MLITDIHDLSSEEVEFRFARDEFSLVEGHLAVNGLVPLRLDQVSRMYGPTEEVELSDVDVLDPDNALLGYLCLSRQLGEIDVPALTDVQYAAYLVDVPKENFGLPYRFTHDYIVIAADRVLEYNAKYRSMSSVWGGFLHEGGRQIAAFKRMPTAIVAHPNLSFPTPFHEENCIRSVAEPYAFERFLKLYHLFELLFDWDFVQRIQGLGTDLLGVGKLLAEYERTELDRLKSVMGHRCTRIDRLSTALSALGNSDRHLEIARAVFFTFGKSGNPFTGPSAEESFNEVYKRGGFSAENLKGARVNGFDVRKFDVFAVSCAAYWIYRVRSSIAHNRIGEYVMTVEDESFVGEFAEPLIRELLIQALGSQPGGAQDNGNQG